MNISRYLVLVVEFCKVGVGHGGKFTISPFQYPPKLSDLIELP